VTTPLWEKVREAGQIQRREREREGEVCSGESQGKCFLSSFPLCKPSAHPDQRQGSMASESPLPDLLYSLNPKPQWGHLSMHVEKVKRLRRVSSQKSPGFALGTEN
jgi:hypothetical protein